MQHSKMIKILCDDTLEGTDRKRITLFDEETGDVIMTDGLLYETEEEAMKRITSKDDDGVQIQIVNYTHFQLLLNIEWLALILRLLN